MFNVLVIEQNLDLKDSICAFFTKHNYKVTSAFDIYEAKKELEKHFIDICIIDIDTNNGINDIDFLRELEILEYHIPAISILTATDIKTKAVCYDYGADAVLPKPIDYEDVLLVLKSILRCSMKATSDVIRFGNTTVTYSSLSVSYITEKKNQIVALPPKEFYLLYMLLRSPNRIFIRQQIMDEIWDYDCESDYKTVNTHINRLRKNFKNHPDFEIITIKNLGYKAILTGNKNR